MRYTFLLNIEIFDKDFLFYSFFSYKIYDILFILWVPYSGRNVFRLFIRYFSCLALMCNLVDKIESTIILIVISVYFIDIESLSLSLSLSLSPPFPFNEPLNL